MCEQHIGPDHNYTLACLLSLGELYKEQGQYEQAQPLLERALTISEQLLGPHHRGTGGLLASLGELYREQGQYEQAQPLLERALAILEQQLGSDDVRLWDCRRSCGLLYRDLGNYEQATSMLQQVALRFEHLLGEAHPKTVKVRNELLLFLEQKRNSTSVLSEEQHEHEKLAQRSLPQDGSHRRALSEDAQARLQQEMDPLQEFLHVCCELHPRAWSRSSDLWGAYQRWVQEYHERFPLSRRAFAAQLRMHGCRPDHTKTARIWRGISIVHDER
jgi:tetratricopeptide (TPR) repeat protein